MLNKSIIAKITEFVRQQPRTIQEIARLIDKNWRTADRYVEQIAQESGLIGVRTFREGSRGALKIVFWRSLEGAKGSVFQERMLDQIERGKNKEDFSSFDIYQFVDPAHREAFVQTSEFSNEPKLMYDKIMLKANVHVLSFSGNLSWIGLRPEMMKAIEANAKRKIGLKILTRIDFTSWENVEKVLAINARVGWDAVQVRHCEQPLRAVIVDEKLVLLKQVMSPTFVRELKEKTFLYYLIDDAEWVSWLERVFYHLWGQSVDAKTRIDALATLKRI